MLLLLGNGGTGGGGDDSATKAPKLLFGIPVGSEEHVRNLHTGQTSNLRLMIPEPPFIPPPNGIPVGWDIMGCMPGNPVGWDIIGC